MSRLIFPKEILDQHLVVLGKTGAGKSSALRHIVEYLLEHKKRVCIIDPKGDWWGLKASADGKGAGYPIIAFGDFKNEAASDVPINAQSGKHVAELVATGNRPCVIGFRGWMTSHMVQFWIDFSAGIFNANQGELYLVGDEFHNFAPKGKIMDPQAGKCLHWSNRLMSEGRGLGIVCLIASQRPQKVHNDTLTSCETLVAMRVVHAADRGAVEDWIKGAGDKDQGRVVLYGDDEKKVPGLAALSRGQAWVWSPEAGFGPKLVTFPMFATFDSFAPPQLQKKVSQRGWADVDLDEVKGKLAAAIEEHRANDPKALRAELAKVKAELAKRLVGKVHNEITTVEKAVLKDGHLQRLEKVHEQIQSEFARAATNANALIARADEVLKPVREVVQLISSDRRPHSAPSAQLPRAVAPPIPRRATSIRETAGTGLTGSGENTAPGGGLRRILVALAQRPNGLTPRQIGVFAGLSSKGGTFSTYLSRARSNGWIEGNGLVKVTTSGIESLGPFETLPTGDGLYRYWLQKIGGGGAARILEVLHDSYPSTLAKSEVAERAGISAAGGTFSTYLSRLRSLELISGNHELRASDEFFEG